MANSDFNFFELLNDLMLINNDRIASYEKAIRELEDSEDDKLKSLFNIMIIVSHSNNTELERSALLLKEPATSDTSISGKLYRLWSDIKPPLTYLSNRKGILENCEKIEDAVQEVYKNALSTPGLFPEIFTLISIQKANLQDSHSQIKKLRDQEYKQ